MESPECHTGFCDSGSDLIINVHCYGESASQVGEFINNFQFLSIHSDGWFSVRFSRCWLVNNLCLFCVDCEIIVIVTINRAQPQQTPSVEKHAHPPRVVYCAIYSTLTRFTKLRV